MVGANIAGILPALGDSAQLFSKLSKYLENLKYSNDVKKEVDIKSGYSQINNLVGGIYV